MLSYVLSLPTWETSKVCISLWRCIMNLSVINCWTILIIKHIRPQSKPTKIVLFRWWRRWMESCNEGKNGRRVGKTRSWCFARNTTIGEVEKKTRSSATRTIVRVTQCVYIYYPLWNNDSLVLNRAIISYTAVRRHVVESIKPDHNTTVIWIDPKSSHTKFIRSDEICLYFFRLFGEAETVSGTLYA